MFDKLSNVVYYGGLLLIVIMLSGCVVGKDIYFNSAPRDYMQPPAVVDSLNALLVEPDSAEVYIPVEDNYGARLRNLRLQDYSYPRQGGGVYRLIYQEDVIVYAAIVGPENVTQEDIVFFGEKWYYNQGDKKTLIDQNRANKFVETILESVASQENEVNNGGS